MSSTLKVWKILTDPTRLRILRLMEKEALTVSELQEILSMGQSRISTHLSQLTKAELLSAKREGKRTYYALTPVPESKQIAQVALQAASELPESAKDQAGLNLVLHKRKETARLYFNQVAGRFGKNYGPGRSWQAFAQMLLPLLPENLVIADLGAGEGLVSQLLARSAKKVIAVDHSEKMVQFGREQAKKNGLKNLEFRQGDIEEPPLDEESVDIVLLSQALHHAANPRRALAAARKLLRPSGKLVILDLNEHNFDQARQMYGDHWLGFSQGDLRKWIEEAGFEKIRVDIVSREDQAPHFQTILATAIRPA
ncbi:MAG: metalloregulator ArsR/SmtB family transcription factor [Verrucomicrobiota bacterium]|nr:metalloregulator ArsR/SmtB family transcription factor [Verrucomicrobiota bacterium]